jgi:hypothetical protein
MASKAGIKGETLKQPVVGSSGQCPACGAVRGFLKEREGYAYKCPAVLRRRGKAPQTCRTPVTTTRALFQRVLA